MFSCLPAVTLKYNSTFPVEIVPVALIKRLLLIRLIVVRRCDGLFSLNGKSILIVVKPNVNR